jgi:EAL domain-containing protein (putative c-di-GMP-specific phosphodiesterase class I)
MGVTLSIDDFGTGYSSLSYLKRYQVDKLKIDQSFVRDLDNGPQDNSIVAAIIHMAHGMGFKTIAEGVETQAQLAYLRAHGCDEIQGYLFSRPVPADTFAQLLQLPLLSTLAN